MDEKRDRGGKQFSAGYRAGFADAYELGKKDAETVRDLTAQVARETGKKIEQGLERAQGQVKPRRTRKARDTGPVAGEPGSAPA